MQDEDGFRVGDMVVNDQKEIAFLVLTAEVDEGRSYAMDILWITQSYIKLIKRSRLSCVCRGDTVVHK